jgi:uncharacterized protein YkwD
MTSSDHRRAPTRPDPGRPADGARPDLAGFAAGHPAAPRRRRLFGAGLLAALVVGGAVTAGLRYGPWLAPAGTQTIAADAAPPSSPPPTTVPSTVTTSTMPEATTVPSTAPPATVPATTAAPPPARAVPATRAATRAASVAPAGGATPSAPAGSGWQGEMLASVNAERAKAGVRPLAACAALNRAAQNYADTMAASGVLSHTGPDGSTLAGRVRAAGYNMAPGGGYVSYAENIAQGYPTVAAVMSGWMGSSGHRTNLLASGTTHIGVGRHGAWWVQDFGSGGTC